MNFANSLGFVAVGSFMWLLPELAPGWFPRIALDGTSTRELWVELMGLVQLVIGAAFIVQHAMSFARGSLAFARRRLAELATSRPRWEPAVSPVENAFAHSRPSTTTVARFPSSLEQAGTVTLQGAHAVLWRSIERAVHAGDSRSRTAGTSLVYVNPLTGTHHPFSLVRPRDFVHLVQASVVDFPARARQRIQEEVPQLVGEHQEAVA